MDGKTEFTILDGIRTENGKMEVRQKSRNCAERVCHLLKCDTGTAKQFLFVSSVYLYTTKT